MRTRVIFCLLPILWSAVARAHDWNGLVVDREDRVYVIDAEDGQIWRISPQGRVTVLVPGTRAAPLNHPHHLSIDEQGTLWLASG